MISEIINVLDSHRAELKNNNEYEIIIFSLLETDTTDFIKLEKRIKVSNNIIDYNDVVVFCKELKRKYENCGYSYMGVNIEAHTHNEIIDGECIELV